MSASKERSTKFTTYSSLWDIKITFDQGGAHPFLTTEISAFENSPAFVVEASLEDEDNATEARLEEISKALRLLSSLLV